MEYLYWLYGYIKLIIEISFGIIGIIFVLFLLYSWIANIITIVRFKREWWDNNEKYSVKRCIEEGEIKEGRDHFYLINIKNSKYHHINPYTLGKLGYPRPPRVDEKKDENNKFYFEKNKYILGHEIKIRNIISNINTIKNLKN